MKNPRVAFVHDWLNGMRGGEVVLEALIDLYPDAPIFTFELDRSGISKKLSNRDIRTSWFNRLPFVHKLYRHYLPIMPLAARTLDLTAYDLVISSSHCIAKAIRIRSNANHICYCHSPMRYVWDRFDDYFSYKSASFMTALIGHIIRLPLRRWDRKMSSLKQVTKFVANSKFVASRIRQFYNRDSTVIYPFANLERFINRDRNPESFYLMMGAFAPNKRVDLAIDAFRLIFEEKGLKQAPHLVIIGGGQNEDELKKNAPPNVQFLGRQSNEVIADHLSRAKAFVFPGVEDFGITLVEAMAAGCPVIAYKAAGALESLTDETALFFLEPTAESLKQAVLTYESGVISISSSASRLRARQFSKSVFLERFSKEVQEMLSEGCRNARQRID